MNKKESENNPFTLANDIGVKIAHRQVRMSDLRAGRSGRGSGQPQNLVGWQVRRLRLQQRLSQPALATRCQLVGYDLSRESLAKIEGRIRTVTDAEVVLLAQALCVPFALLYPPEEELTGLLKPFQNLPLPAAG